MEVTSVCRCTFRHTLTRKTDNPTDANQSVSGWCSEGHCYGASQTNLSVPEPIPFDITCGNSSACSGTLYGSVDAVFANGPQIGT